jgi:transposase
MRKGEKAVGMGGQVVPADGREGERSEPERPGEGVTASWAARGRGRGGDPEVPEKARRRQFTAEYKLRVVREADGCSKPGGVGALLRREGLYSSQLSKWRQQRDEGALGRLGSRRRGRSRRDPLAREVERLRRDNERLKGKLAQAELVIEIQKKASQMLGIPLRSPDDEESGS